MDAICVCDLRDGDAVDWEFGVVECVRKTTTAGKPYALLSVRDATASISAKKWDLTEIEWNSIDGVQCVHLSGWVKTYQGKLEINATGVRAGADPRRTEGFIPAYPGDRGREWKALGDLLLSVQDVHLAGLLRRIFHPDGFRKQFCEATAAQKMHHVGVGGLLAHTLEVADLCMAMADRAPGLRRDLLLTGAILHDIGKIDEIDTSRVDFSSTLEGGFLGHVVLGAARVQREIDSMPDFPPQLRAEVIHLILSHQGQKEWGAPVTPAIPEAIVLHLCDNASAKLDEVASARTAAGTAALFAWSSAIRSHVFLGEIQVSPAPAATHPSWSLEDNGATGRPVLRIVAGGLEKGEALPEMAALPILGSIAAGVPIEAQEHVEGYLALPLDTRSEAGDFLLRVTGESMRDAHILSGDLVRVRPLRDEPQENDVVAALLNGEVTVKRFRRNGVRAVLHPENPDFPDIPVSEADDLQIQGKVVGLIRDKIA